MATETRTVTATFRVIVEGFAGDLEATGTLEELQGLAAKMKKLGIAPGNSPLLWGDRSANGAGSAGGGDTNAPVCPVHGRPMARSKFPNGGFYCTGRNADGGFCKETVRQAA